MSFFRDNLMRKKKVKKRKMRKTKENYRRVNQVLDVSLHQHT